MDIDRTKRIKEARDEAKKEIDTYRQTKEAEFKKFESEVRLEVQPYMAPVPRMATTSMPHQFYDSLDKYTVARIVMLTRPLAHERKQAGRRGCEQGGRVAGEGDSAGRKGWEG